MTIPDGAELTPPGYCHTRRGRLHVLDHPPARTASVRGDDMLQTTPITDPPDDAAPYRPGDIAIRLTDREPLVVLRVLDWRDVPDGGWLVTADSPGTGVQQYPLTDLRPIHETDMDRHPIAQRVRRLVRYRGARTPRALRGPADVTTTSREG